MCLCDTNLQRPNFPNASSESVWSNFQTNDCHVEFNTPSSVLLTLVRLVGHVYIILYERHNRGSGLRLETRLGELEWVLNAHAVLISKRTCSSFKTSALRPALPFLLLCYSADATRRNMRAAVGVTSFDLMHQNRAWTQRTGWKQRDRALLVQN